MTTNSCFSYSETVLYAVIIIIHKWSHWYNKYQLIQLIDSHQICTTTDLLSIDIQCTVCVLCKDHYRETDALLFIC